ncbi:hypothetical protein ACFFLM_21195 [Deinococcus oregonensis]|uniref:Uncharacterized protein n=1 Tax=Deinococcus oregonensis TaxID=1805970 RepID=A0ABV6B7T2_9DEIO
MSNAKKFSVKKNQAPTQSRAYPVQVCSTRYRDPVTGYWTSKPKDAPEAGKLRKGRSVSDRAIVTRLKDSDGEVVNARVILPAFRAGQRRGKIKLSEVRDTERELSRDALATYNPRRAAEIDLERMHEAHRSDKAKRGAATKAKNKAAGRTPKKRPVDVIKTELLRTEELVKDARRRHDGAKTYKTRATHAQTLKTRQQRASKLRAELKQVSG